MSYWVLYFFSMFRGTTGKVGSLFYIYRVAPAFSKKGPAMFIQKRVVRGSQNAKPIDHPNRNTKTGHVHVIVWRRFQMLISAFSVQHNCCLHTGDEPTHADSQLLSRG